MNAAPARRARGFTLIEMLISLAILALLASMAAPLVQVAAQRSKEQALRLALRELRDGIDAYKRAADAGLIEKLAGTSGYPPDLEVLVSGVRDVRSASGQRMYFLRRIPRDPFSADPPTASPRWGLRSHDSPPDDPRPGVDVFDVHSLSAARALDGTHYREW